MRRSSHIALVALGWIGSSIAVGVTVAVGSPGGDLPVEATAVVLSLWMAVVQIPMAVIYVLVHGRGRAAAIWAGGLIAFLVALHLAGSFAYFVYYAACVVLGVLGGSRAPVHGAAGAN